ncbi:MAG: acyl-CoA thioesterase [Planctomycetia bacterium]|nr:acyl-CoA thioesterase [Planctomycetia bacterium]
MPATRAPNGVYRTTRSIRFADVDFARILYFPRQFHFLHIAMEDFFREVLDIPYATLLKRDRIGFPTVHLDADFLAPQEFGDEVEIAMRVVEVGRSRVVFAYEVTARGGVAARCRQTTVAVDMETWKSIALPENYRAALEQVKALEGGGTQ